MNETLSIRLDDNLAHALSVEARSTGLSKGAIARQALESHLQHGGKFKVMPHYFGIASGPPDLSTNKKYRRLWGKKPA